MLKHSLESATVMLFSTDHCRVIGDAINVQNIVTVTRVALGLLHNG